VEHFGYGTVLVGFLPDQLERKVHLVLLELQVPPESRVQQDLPVQRVQQDLLVQQDSPVQLDLPEQQDLLVQREQQDLPVQQD
jgi:hypothetical protein